MSKLTDSIETLYNNPFIFSQLFISFYKHNKKQPKDILLSYLILPLILHDKSREKLSTCKKNSSIRTLTKKDKKIFHGLYSRISHYKHLTNLSIQFAIDNGYLKLHNDLSISFIKDMDYSFFDKKYYKSAEKLNNIFKDYNVIKIYRLLGVKEL